MRAPASVPHIGVLALQGAFAAHQQMLERMQVPVRLIYHPDDLSSVDGLIIPGGESTTLLHLMQYDGLFEALKAFTASHPCLGTCAGLIVLAQAVLPAQASFNQLPITVQRNAYGRQRDSQIRLGSTTLPGSSTLEMPFIRAPRIVQWNAAVQVIAWLDQDPVLVQYNHLIGSTFHPELSLDTRVHQLLVDACLSGGSLPA